MSHQLSLSASFSHKTNLNFALQAYKFGKLTSTPEIFSRHPKLNLQFFTVNRNTGTQFHCKLDLPLISQSVFNYINLQIFKICRSFSHNIIIILLPGNNETLDLANRNKGKSKGTAIRYKAVTLVIDWLWECILILLHKTKSKVIPMVNWKEISQEGDPKKQNKPNA